MAVLSPVAEILNITIEQGATFRLGVTIKDDQATPQAIDLTDTVIEAQIRKRHDSTLIAAFTVDNRVDLSGTFDLVLAYATTEAIEEDGVWDLEILYTTGDKYRYLKGSVTISVESTK